MNLLGTIFSSGLIRIWCSSEYLLYYDGICGLNQNKQQSSCSWSWTKHVAQYNGAIWRRGIRYIRLWVHSVISSLDFMGFVHKKKYQKRKCALAVCLLYCFLKRTYWGQTTKTNYIYFDPMHGFPGWGWVICILPLRHNVILPCHYSNGSSRLQQDSLDTKLYVSQSPLTFSL